MMSFSGSGSLLYIIENLIVMSVFFVVSIRVVDVGIVS